MNPWTPVRFSPFPSLTKNENLKWGGSTDVFFNTADLLRPNSAVYTNHNRQQINTRFGIGLENPKKYSFDSNEKAGTSRLEAKTSG